MVAGGVEEVQSSCEVGLVRVVLAAPRGAVEGLCRHVHDDVRLESGKQRKETAAVEDVAFVVLVVEDRVVATVGGGAGESMGLPSLLFTGCHEWPPIIPVEPVMRTFIVVGAVSVATGCQRLSLTGG